MTKLKSYKILYKQSNLKGESIEKETILKGKDIYEIIKRADKKYNRHNFFGWRFVKNELFDNMKAYRKLIKYKPSSLTETHEIICNLCGKDICESRNDEYEYEVFCDICGEPMSGDLEIFCNNGKEHICKDCKDYKDCNWGDTK